MASLTKLLRRPVKVVGLLQGSPLAGRLAKNVKVEALDFAARVAELGAGEIVMNSVDLDGEMTGYDLDLARRLRERINIPMTMLGGAGKLEHLSDLFAACGVVGAAAGSLFVFKGQYRAVLINYPKPAEKESLFAATR